MGTPFSFFSNHRQLSSIPSNCVFATLPGNIAPLTNSHFTLRKWYLDCVSDSGDAVIVYCAELAWHGIRVHYSSVLAAKQGVVASRTAIATSASPNVESDKISLEIPRLGITGVWDRSAARVQRTILESPEGVVHWDCLQPKADTRVCIADVGAFDGLGYAECLTLTIPPWRLPMRQLRWGRYLSVEDSLVWIDWRGPFTTQVVVHDGDFCTATQVTDTEIKLDRTTLTLDRSLSLRSGRLGDTVLPSAPILRNLLPGSLFRIEETKWRSRGTLTSPERHSSGWAIHEVVHWNA